MPRALKQILVFVLAAGFALACQTKDQATEQGSETSPAIDTAAVSAAIAVKDKAYGEAAAAGDVEAIMQQYAADAILLPPGAPRIEGAQALREMFTGWLKESPPSSLTLNSDAVTVSAAGDYAHSVGSYALSGVNPDGSEYSDQGKFVAVWKSSDGDWKMVADIWNSDSPTPGSAPAEIGTKEAETPPAE
jgi:ketosteroid isomerase-like protein